MTSTTPNATAAGSAIMQIGTQFRRLRELRGERIEDIATYLDIKATYLFGIEQGDLSGLPGRSQAKSMLRSYANYLGLDGSSLVGPLDPILASLDGDNAPPNPEVVSWFDRTSAVILTAAVVFGILAGWSWIGDVNRFDLLTPPVTANVVSEEPGAEDWEPGVDEETEAPVVVDDRVVASIEPSAELATEGAVGLSGSPSDEVAEATDALLAELKAVAVEEIATDGAAAEAVAEEVIDAAESVRLAAVEAQVVKGEERPANVLAALVAERGDGAHIYEAENTDARVIVRALGNVLVQITSQARDYVWTQTMKPREMLMVPNRNDLELWTGDAGSVELLLDGVILPPLGPPNTPLSGMSLTASSLLSLTAEVPESNVKPTF